MCRCIATNSFLLLHNTCLLLSFFVSKMFSLLKHAAQNEWMHTSPWCIQTREMIALTYRGRTYFIENAKARPLTIEISALGVSESVCLLEISFYFYTLRRHISKRGIQTIHKAAQLFYCVLATTRDQLISGTGILYLDRSFLYVLQFSQLSDTNIELKPNDVYGEGRGEMVISPPLSASHQTRQQWYRKQMCPIEL